MAKKLFRKISLDRLSSPEQLDQVMTVTTPRAWMALAAMGLLVLAVTIWGIWGSIPYKTYGKGILMTSGGIHSITHPSSGILLDIRVYQGDRVKQGDVVARLEQPDLVKAILREQHALEVLEKEPVLNEEAIDSKKRDIETLQQELLYASNVIAPVNGRILESRVTKGDMVEPGKSLFSIVEEGTDTQDLVGILYIPASQGKQVLPGMEVHVSPAAVKKEEYGYMLGRVVSVSQYPATAQGMLLTLGNEELVNELAGESAPVEIRVELEINQETVSGYLWSTPQGPPGFIDSGTLCSGSVTIVTQRPIQMILPSIRNVIPLD